MCSLDGTPCLRTHRLATGVEIVIAKDLRDAFRPHKHDCYVVGITDAGVQSFRYRGAQRRASPGEAFAIHPDETHDGQPGTDLGYSYRAIYLAPDLVSDALETLNAPFVLESINRDEAFIMALQGFFDLTSLPQDDLALSDGLTQLADAMQVLSGHTGRYTKATDILLSNRIREDLYEHAFTKRPMVELERDHGLSRFAITRLFRRRFGVSPQQFVINRRIAKARDLISDGTGLAEAAYASGFSDQSHLTRHFIKTVGTTPNKWRNLTHVGKSGPLLHPDE